MDHLTMKQLLVLARKLGSALTPLDMTEQRIETVYKTLNLHNPYITREMVKVADDKLTEEEHYEEYWEHRQKELAKEKEDEDDL